MYYLQICAAFVTIALAFAERGSPCTTPTGEKVTCVSVLNCPGILNSLLTKNATVIADAKQYQCGWDTEPLVCCKFSDYAPQVFDTFTGKPERPTQKLNETSAETSAEIPSYTLTPTPEPDYPYPELPSSFDTSVLPNTSVCGLQKGTIRILSGVIADFVEFTWLAALEYNSKYTGQNAGIRCTGSIINDRFILTAAQCIVDLEFEPVSALLGEWRLTTDPDCEELVANVECTDKVVKTKITKKIAHPFYSRKTGNNDIGLLKLQNIIKYTNHISPVCLPPPQLPSIKVGNLLSASGWGTTRSGAASQMKLKKTVEIVPNISCKKDFTDKLINVNQICGVFQNGTGPYRGDIGGPLMRAYSNRGFQRDQWYQEGVGSWGAGSIEWGNPVVYTRVTRYIQWIVNNMHVYQRV